MDDDLGVGGRLEDATAPHQTAAGDVGVGEVSVVGDGEAAELEFGEQRLHVAQHRAAGGGIAHVAEGDGSGKSADHVLGAEVVADQAERTVGVELLAVEGD